MEELVGNLWHKYITHKAQPRFAAAAVELKDQHKKLNLLLHAWGADAGLQIQNAVPAHFETYQGNLKKIAGTGHRHDIAQKSAERLCLPGKIDLYPDASLNLDLYRWLTAMAAYWPDACQNWFLLNQQVSAQVLTELPGLTPLYQRLCAAEIARRPALSLLPGEIAEQEMVIRHALQNPGSELQLPVSHYAPVPVTMWLYPDMQRPAAAKSSTDTQDDSDSEGGHKKNQKESDIRREAERSEHSSGRTGLLLFRLESLFSWSEFMNLDRTQDDADDGAEEIAEDLDMLHLSNEQNRSASKIKFDLEVPSAYSDDEAISGNILLPEWDYKKQQLQENHVSLHMLQNLHCQNRDIPEHLQKIARQIRAQFSQLKPQRMWRNRQEDGCEIDIDSWIEFNAEKSAGHTALKAYRDLNQKQRDICTLLLADLSLSTDAYVNNEQRVLDVIKDSLGLFAEALNTLGDPFALYGFSSKQRQMVRFHEIKSFAEHNMGKVRARIEASKPGYYTRMGAAIRQSTKLLAGQPQRQKLLLLLTDGKPNDLDKYEGRYGIEDTRHAVQEARQQGIHPFAITIDKKAELYLPYIFGSQGFVLIHQPEQLPLLLPKLYQQLSD
ncbi:MAG: VWA domain-containing protein [Oceanospirillaceae bacterium]|nr:VWA domain-containing protein [Oceanospirillaceae bacterium]